MNSPPPPENRAAAGTEAPTATNSETQRKDTSQTAKSKPFIPSWLDDLDLSQPEFRLYCHLCRRAGRDGIAWTNAETIRKVCRVSRNTVWPTIENLESKHHLIKRLGKPFGRANRYQVLVPITPNETPIETPSITPNETPIEALPITPNGAPPITPNEGRQSDQMERHKGSPKKVIHRRVSNREKTNGFVPSVEANQFAVWFKSSLPQDQQDGLHKNWHKKYCEAYDEMIRLDKKTPEQIREVCQWARTDSFWKQQIRTPGKLRERDKQGTKYFDVITERMKQPSGQSSKPAATVNAGRRRSQEETISCQMP